MFLAVTPIFTALGLLNLDHECIRQEILARIEE